MSFDAVGGRVVEIAALAAVAATAATVEEAWVTCDG